MKTHKPLPKSKEIITKEQQQLVDYSFYQPYVYRTI